MAGTSRDAKAALQTYRRKRDFSRTPEPEGRPAPGASGRMYVIQKHAARALHYDFRLELDGVLKSWAVPKGPSLDPSDKRLAMETEDHPVAYGDFEGIIPKGQYGGGTVMLWDRGTWSPQGDAREGYRKGALKFRLEGEKLEGGWALVRIRGRDSRSEGRTWLLIKEKDDFARPGEGSRVVERETESVATGRDMDAIAAQKDAVWRSNRDDEDRRDVSEPTAPRVGIARSAGRTAASSKSARTRSEASKSAQTRGADTSSSLGSARGSSLGSSLGSSVGSRGRATGPALVPGARKGRMPRIGTPQHPTLVTAPPSGDEWLHEMKFDGYRVLCHASGAKVRLVSRNGSDWTSRFPAIVKAVKALKADVLLDGEVAVLLPDGTTSFQALQNAMREGSDQVVFFVFDLLFWNGHDLTRAPLIARKEALRSLIAPATGRSSPILRYSEHVLGRGEEFFRSACGMSLEGVVSKRADAPYEPGRSRSWLKVKCVREQEVVIGGYTEPSGSRVGIGALLVGVHEGKGLRYAGKVGTGYTQEILRELRRRLTALERASSPFEGRVPGAARARWVAPRLVAQVRFTEWTRDGRMRHPSFEGMRLDKKAAEVVREEPSDTKTLTDGGKRAGRTASGPVRSPRTVPARTSTRRAPSRKAVRRTAPYRARAGGATESHARAGAPPRRSGVERATPPRRSTDREVEVAGVRITHPDRVLDPDSGITKADLAAYYDVVADRILPHLQDRPLTLVRCPEGIAGGCFYMKHASRLGMPGSVRRVRIREKTKTDVYLIVDSREALVGLVQMGVIEVHTWNARYERLETPDRIVIDLDPGPGVSWARVVESAHRVRETLAVRGLESFPKTTGGKGLHVVAPLQPTAGWDACFAFSRDLVSTLAGESPREFVATMSKEQRKGRIFIDYLRNNRGATSVAPYSARARPGATVSVPLTWNEVTEALRPGTFTVRTLARRLGRLRRDPWAGYAKTRQRLPAASKRPAR